jgi:hypothetical protein
MNYILIICFSYQNGFAYQYLQGATVSANRLLDPQIIRLVIGKMHQIHAFHPPPAIYPQGFDMGLFYTKSVIADWRKLVATQALDSIT